MIYDRGNGLLFHYEDLKGVNRKRKLFFAKLF